MTKPTENQTNRYNQTNWEPTCSSDTDRTISLIQLDVN